MIKTRALFLDRDGVINQDTGYPHQIEDIIFIEGALKFIRNITSAGWPIFIITNQAGIAHGYYSEDEFTNLMDWYIEKIEHAGGKIQKFYYCPHHENAVSKRYRKKCSHRKPAPGMFLSAAKDYCLDLSNSCFIGDRKTDEQAAKNAGIQHYFYINPQNTEAQFSRILSVLKSL